MPKHLFQKGIFLLAASSCLILSNSAMSQFGAGYGPPLVTEAPERIFNTSDAHYAWLLEQAEGGTEHTFDTLPRWDGLWVTAGNTQPSRWARLALRSK